MLVFKFIDPQLLPPSAPPPGSVVLHADYRPTLPSAAYTLQVQQVVTPSPPSVVTPRPDIPPLPGREFKLEVTGPRFVLPPDAVHAVYPPANAAGSFETRLPQVVLHRRTLPWERTMPSGVPWLALLLFEGEAEMNEIRSADATVGKILARTSTQNPAFRDPGLTPAEMATPCMGIELPLPLFQALAPTADDLELLTHVRRVNTEDKELLGQDDDGWFAVVLANRLPRSGHKYTACLVSLEGHWLHLPPQQAIPDAAACTVRLVTLARWQFTCAGRGDFQSIMTALPTRGGVDLLATPPPDRDKLARVIVSEYGHVQLAHTTREGEATVAWYRGPLVPLRLRPTATGPYHAADQARQVDPESGLENLGYAAAFELGRLLALADAEFSLDLLRWRRGDYQAAHAAVVRKDLPMSPVPPNVEPSLVVDVDPLSPVILPDLLRSRALTLADRRVDPTGLAAHRMPGLDLAQVARTYDLAPALVDRLLRNPTIDPVRPGAADLPDVQQGFDALVNDAGLAEVQHLAVVRVEVTDLTTRGGFQ